MTEPTPAHRDDGKVIVHLGDHRRPVNYTVSITQHFDGRIECWVADMADDERSRNAVMECLERVAASYCAKRRAPQEEPPLWSDLDLINAWGRVTAELGLPWGATASRVLEVIRGASGNSIPQGRAWP